MVGGDRGRCGGGGGGLKNGREGGKVHLIIIISVDAWHQACLLEDHLVKPVKAGVRAVGFDHLGSGGDSGRGEVLQLCGV